MTCATESLAVVSERLKQHEEFEDAVNEHFEKHDEDICQKVQVLHKLIDSYLNAATEQGRTVRSRILKRLDAHEKVAMQRHATFQTMNLAAVYQCAVRAVFCCRLLSDMAAIHSVGSAYFPSALIPKSLESTVDLSKWSPFRMAYPFCPQSPIARLQSMLQLASSTQETSNDPRVVISPKCLKNPRGIAVHPTNGSIYASNYSDNKIVILDQHTLQPINTIGKHGPESGEFRNPTDVTFSPALNMLLVLEEEGNRIQFIDATTHETVCIVGEKAGEPNNFNSPWFMDIYCTEEEMLYISDRANRRIVTVALGENPQVTNTFSVADEPSGVVVAPFGTPGSRQQQGTEDHTILTVGCGGSTIYEYSSSGVLLNSYKIDPTSSGYVNTLRCGPHDTFLLCDYENGIIRLYSNEFQLISQYNWSKPVGLAFDDQENLYIVNRRHGTVSKISE
eukprot:TRINITY_DN17364_c0_g1_i1.p1 TRINITY_DN17364_c0_g1~~TRINITY_DN17364_c0_g1_i1.p1  ORF type:complete len:449 (-),score=79.44 TRINITY_DN17364_c0_g1_i1:104-1450(-)